MKMSPILKSYFPMCLESVRRLMKNLNKSRELKLEPLSKKQEW
jgi:hypothetical protein